MDIEFTNILKVSSSNESLLLQEYITQVQTISVVTFQQQNYSLKDIMKSTSITALDANTDNLFFGNEIGQLFIINPLKGSLVQEIWAHQDKIIYILALRDFCYSICMNGELKQTSCSTGQVIYSKKLTNRIYQSSIFHISNSFLIQYDSKVILMNLDQDTITKKYQISHQTPLKVKQYGQYFSVLGNEQSISQYELQEITPQLMFSPQIQASNYHFVKTQAASYYILQNTNQIQGLKFDETNQQTIIFNVNLKDIIGTFMVKSDFILLRGNITSPNIKKIKFIIEKKIKINILGEQLEEYSEAQKQQTSINQKTNNQIQQEVPVGYQDFEYTTVGKTDIQSIVDRIDKQSNNESQPLMLTNLLEQALKSQDTQLIDFALERTAANLISGSVQSLSLQNVQALQDYVVKKVVSYPYQSKVLLPWMKSIIMRGHGDFTALYYTLEERTQNFQKIKDLDTRLSFLKNKSQPKQGAQSKNKILFIESLDQITVINEEQNDQDKLNQEEEEFEESYQNEKDFDAALKMRQYEDRQDALEQEKGDKPQEEFIKF